MEYKALDQILQTYDKDTGEKKAITYRCGDMDRIVPGLMGVSKAIPPFFAPLGMRDYSRSLSSARPTLLKGGMRETPNLERRRAESQ